MVDITVQGAAVRRAVAERARIEIRSRCTEDAPGAAMQRATEAHARAVAEVRSLETAGAVDTWSADRAWVQHHEEWVGEGRRPRLRFTATATVTARFRDLGREGARETEHLGEGGVDALTVEPVGDGKTAGLHGQISADAAAPSWPFCVASSALCA